MIFLTVGTEKFSFHRLVQRADELARAGAFGPDELWMQIGSSTYAPTHAGFERFLPFDEMRERIRAARVVISHAGAGSSLLCLQCGRKPIVVPRAKAFQEHVDDHQLNFAERLHLQGLVHCVSDLNDLAKAVTSQLDEAANAQATLSNGEVVAHLEQLISGWEAA
ncbi:MAG: UDP-N-acetylglucosamine transferase subunit ALG13 [Planctomycetota bacterium]|jgi:UDP-N-acetylglucosamine transferase subunit ALG13